MKPKPKRIWFWASAPDTFIFGITNPSSKSSFFSLFLSATVYRHRRFPPPKPLFKIDTPVFAKALAFCLLLHAPMEASVKQELIEPLRAQGTSNNHEASNAFPSFIDLSSDSEPDSEDSEQEVVDGILGGVTRSVGLPNGVDGGFLKKRRLNELEVVLPLGFLPPAAPDETHAIEVSLPPSDEAATIQETRITNANASACKQFWKAGDYEGAPCSNWDSSSGMS